MVAEMSRNKSRKPSYSNTPGGKGGDDFLVGALLNMQSAMSQMQTTLGKFDARFEHLDARFEHLDARFEHLHSGQVAVEKKLDRLTQKVDELCVTSARHDVLLDQMHSGQMAVARKVDDLNKKVDELCITSAKHESRLDQLGESHAEMKAVFSVAASEIGKLMNWRQRLLMAAFVIVGMTSLLGFVLVNGANIVQNSPMFMKAPDQAP
jgi:peptidoglycan hydrolase CwlO-like protein